MSCFLNGSVAGSKSLNASIRDVVAADANIGQNATGMEMTR